MFDQLVSTLQSTKIRVGPDDKPETVRVHRTRGESKRDLLCEKILAFISANPGVPIRAVYESVESPGYNNICSSISYMERIGRLRSEMRPADPKWARYIVVVKHYWSTQENTSEHPT